MERESSDELATLGIDELADVFTSPQSPKSTRLRREHSLANLAFNVGVVFRDGAPEERRKAQAVLIRITRNGEENPYARATALAFLQKHGGPDSEIQAAVGAFQQLMQNHGMVKAAELM